MKPEIKGKRNRAKDGNNSWCFWNVVKMSSSVEKMYVNNCRYLWKKQQQQIPLETYSKKLSAQMKKKHWCESEK